MIVVNGEMGDEHGKMGHERKGNVENSSDAQTLGWPALKRVTLMNY